MVLSSTLLENLVESCESSSLMAWGLGDWVEQIDGLTRMGGKGGAVENNHFPSLYSPIQSHTNPIPTQRTHLEPLLLGPVEADAAQAHVADGGLHHALLRGVELWGL